MNEKRFIIFICNDLLDFSRAMVAAQLTDQSFTTPEGHGFNPVISVCFRRKDKIKKERPMYSKI